MEFNAEIVYPAIISSIKSAHDVVRRAALERMTEAPAYFSLLDPYLRRQLGDIILECTKDDNLIVVTQAWLAVALLSGEPAIFDNRDVFWSGLGNSNPWVVEGLFEKLNLYSIPAIFDAPDDAKQLKELYGKFGARVDAQILDVLRETGGEEPLLFLSHVKYRPEGWKKSMS
jgi:hypothetical protein